MKKLRFRVYLEGRPEPVEVIGVKNDWRTDGALLVFDSGGTRDRLVAGFERYQGFTVEYVEVDE